MSSTSGKTAKRIGLIAGKSGEALVREFHRRGVEVVLVCGKEGEPGLELADSALVADLRERKKITEFLLSSGIDGFVFGTGMRFVFPIAEDLKNRGIALSHAYESSRAFKDKFLTKQLFRKAGFLVAEARLIRLIHEARDARTLRFPIVIKARMDEFPVFLCHSGQELEEFVGRLEPELLASGVIAEDYIHGNDITVPVAATHDSVDPLGVVYWSKQVGHKLQGFGELTETRLSPMAEVDLLRACASLLRKVGYFGVCRFDFRVSEAGEPYALEANSIIVTRRNGTSWPKMKEAGIEIDVVTAEVSLRNINSQLAPGKDKAG